MLRPFHSGPSLHRQLPLPLPDPVQPHNRPNEEANRLLTVQLLRGQPDHLPYPNIPLTRCRFHDGKGESAAVQRQPRAIGRTYHGLVLSRASTNFELWDCLDPPIPTAIQAVSFAHFCYH
jgi:hypothetical protein